MFFVELRLIGTEPVIPSAVRAARNRSSIDATCGYFSYTLTL
jgi:hypothetical protein